MVLFKIFNCNPVEKPLDRDVILNILLIEVSGPDKIKYRGVEQSGSSSGS